MFHSKRTLIMKIVAPWFVFSFLIMLSVCSCASNDSESNNHDADILFRLQQLAGITVTELQSSRPQQRLFQIDMEQPIDHNDPNGPKFTQRLYLHHIGETRPMLFAPDGYDTNKDEELGGELMTMLHANLISSSHRYWPGSVPNDPTFQFLTIVQAAADHHAIVAKFKQIYRGVWASAGMSKGGMTVIYHRRFYPTDVNATVAFCAPFKFGTADQRYPEFLETRGSIQDRQRIYDFQRLALIRRESLIPLFEAWFPQNGHVLSFDPDESFEDEVISFQPEFWEKKLIGDIDQIPGDGATDQEILEYLNNVENFVAYSELAIELGAPFFYQAFTEEGLEANSTAHLSDLLITDQIDVLALFHARGVYPLYDPATMNDIANWVVSSGNNMIFIYGENDPWTAGAIELMGLTNAVKVVNPGDNHSVFINELPDAERRAVILALEEWLNLVIE